MTSSFFDEQEEQSRIKAAIVVEYFGAWANILSASSPRLAYIDLFAGPGRYGDGGESTPLLIIRRILASPKLVGAVATIFNDANQSYSDQLATAIQSIPSVDTLRFKPEVSCEQVGDRLAVLFRSLRMDPTLAFMDPWGYKGLSRELIGSVIKDFGSEAIFFFNYNRINPAIDNDRVEAHMDALFSPQVLSNLREQIRLSAPAARESLILRALGDALQGLGGEYLIPFRFARSGATISQCRPRWITSTVSVILTYRLTALQTRRCYSNSVFCGDGAAALGGRPRCS